MFRLEYGFLALTAALFVGGAVSAKTPDGQTPSAETVCDAVAGDAGLFGLCNAYCEAKDCDTQDDAGNGCESLLRNWEARTDADMPCLAKACIECRDEASVKACRAAGGKCGSLDGVTKVCIAPGTKECVDGSGCKACLSDADKKSCYVAGGVCDLGTFCKFEKTGQCVGSGSEAPRCDVCSTPELQKMCLAYGGSCELGGQCVSQRAVDTCVSIAPIK